MLRGRREQTGGHSEVAPSLPLPTPNLSWQVHMRTTPALHELAASGWCLLRTVVQQGLRQMCVQVLPLLLARDTSIDLLRYRGHCNCLASAAAQQNSPCMGEVCCHRNPCRWQSWLLDTCTRDHKKKKKKDSGFLDPERSMARAGWQNHPCTPERDHSQVPISTFSMF